MSLHLQSNVTDLGNLAVAAPVAAVVCAWVVWQRGRVIALAYAGCLIAAVVAAAALKLPFHVLGRQPDQLGPWTLSSGAPSGHMTVATVVWGCAALIFLRTRRPLWRTAGVAGCAIAIAGVAVTRVTLHTHTIADVAAGFVVAGLFVALFDRVLKRRGAAWRPDSGLPLGLAMGATAVVMLLSNLSVTSTQLL